MTSSSFASPSFANAYTIIRVDEQGEPDKIIPWNTNAATYVAASISICQRMLQDKKVRNGFHDLAKDIDDALEKGTAPFKREELTDIVDEYLAHAGRDFPVVFVDYSLHNRDDLGHHWRRSFNDDMFDTSKQNIVINGPLVQLMCTAGAKAEKYRENPNSNDSRRFRRFLFLFAYKFLHELGHLFVTYLGKAHLETPEEVGMTMAQDPDSEGKSRGESGARLERHVLGGYMTIVHDFKEEAEEPVERRGGMFIFSQGDGLWSPIPQELIDRFISYDFIFPLPVLGPKFKREYFPETMGHSMPKSHDSPDPMNNEKTWQLLRLRGWSQKADEIKKASSYPKTFTSKQQSVLKNVAGNPSLRLAAA